MSRTRYVWLWPSPDGVMVFGSAKRGIAYIDRIYPPPEGDKWQLDQTEYMAVWSRGDLYGDNPLTLTRETVL